jgi:hypothetical protein
MAGDSSVYDLIAFFILCISTLTCMFFVASIIYYSRIYTPMRAKSVVDTCWMLVFGLIHMWSTFVSNDHFDWVHSARIVNCELWSFWMQYCIGASGWFCIVVWRVYKYCFIFHSSLSAVSKHVRRVIKMETIAIIILPVAAICTGVSLTGSSSYDTVTMECKTSFGWKIALMSWVAGCEILFIGLCIATRSGISNKFFNEYNAMRDVALLSFALISINAFINFSGYISTPIGRSVFTSIIALMHLFCASRLLLYRLYKAIGKDIEYESSYLRSIEVYETDVSSIRDIWWCDEIQRDFIDVYYASLKEEMDVQLRSCYITLKKYREKGPHNYGEWKRIFNNYFCPPNAPFGRNTLEERDSEYNMYAYMDYMPRCNSETEHVDQDAFAKVEAHVLYLMQDRKEAEYMSLKTYKTVLKDHFAIANKSKRKKKMPIVLQKNGLYDGIQAMPILTSIPFEGGSGDKNGIDDEDTSNELEMYENFST